MVDVVGGLAQPARLALVVLVNGTQNEKITPIEALELTIEGYFVTGSPLTADDIGPGGVDMGIRVISLNN